MDTFMKIRSERATPVNLLFGTDWWTDCDDIVALRLVCRAHKAGIVRLVSVCASAVMEDTAPSIDAFLENEGVKVPIGVDKNTVFPDDRCRYQHLLSQYPHTVESNEVCENAYRLYRKALSSLEGKADIIEIGFTQVLGQLLQSPPDEFSPLCGKELVQEKVGKIWIMAGKWDEPGGKEHNLIHIPASREAGSFLCEHCPVPITFLGFEAGESVITGGGLPQDDLLAVGMKAYGRPEGRSSWDPMLTLMAIVGDEEKAGYRKITGKARVNADTGENDFTPSENGTHAYVEKLFPDRFYADAINELIR